MTSKISRRSFIAGSAALGSAFAALPASAAPAPGDIPEKWDLEADVVVVGGGATGILSAIGCRDAGLDVLIVDTNYDLGGHAICSAGNVPLGSGTAQQKKYGIEDDPETYFKDLTDWTVVHTGGAPEYRFNDRALQHAIAYHSVATYDALIANGVRFVDKAPDNAGGNSIGVSAKREHHCVWKQGQCAEAPAGTGGTTLMRPLERSARSKGVRVVLNYHMDEIFREKGGGRVVGIRAHYTPRILPDGTLLRSFMSEGNITLEQKEITVRAKKAVVVATGGHTGNVEFRRIIDCRITDEYPNAAGEYSPQDASGELASIAIGASLWGTANPVNDRTCVYRKGRVIGTRTNYVPWKQSSPIFPFVKYEGIRIKDWQNAIIVNQVGKRFYDESALNGYPRGTTEGFYKDGKPYVQGDWRNTVRTTFKPENYIDAALAINEGSTAPDFASGPQWAIFDEAAVKREKIRFSPVTGDPECFFKADTIEALAEKINTSPWQKFKMDPKVLAATVERYNGFVEKGADEDFEKPAPKHRIAEGPFYAAWSTFVVHDSMAGLRIDADCRVVDWFGRVIEGLYCGGESAGGSSQHGLGRSLIQGFIIGERIAGK